MKKIGLNAIKTRPHLIAKFPHLFQPGGGFPHFDQILDLTLGLMSDLVICKFRKSMSYMTPNVLTETRCH